MKKLLFFMFLILAGCVRSSADMLDERTAIVSARGTAFDSHAGVTKEVLRRAAQLTVDRGYRYFMVLGVEDTTTHSTMYVPGDTHTMGTYNANVHSYNTHSSVTGTYSGSTYSDPGYVSEFVKPGTDIMIRMFTLEEGVPGHPQLWDAVSILATATQERPNNER